MLGLVGCVGYGCDTESRQKRPARDQQRTKHFLSSWVFESDTGRHVHSMTALGYNSSGLRHSCNRTANSTSQRIGCLLYIPLSMPP